MLSDVGRRQGDHSPGGGDRGAGPGDRGDGQGAVGDGGDLPQVAVADVAGGGAQAPVVRPGQDAVADGDHRPIGLGEAVGGDEAVGDAVVVGAGVQVIVSRDAP